MQQQNGQHRALPPAPERQFPPIVEDLKPTKNPKVHAPVPFRERTLLAPRDPQKPPRSKAFIELLSPTDTISPDELHRRPIRDRTRVMNHRLTSMRPSIRTTATAAIALASLLLAPAWIAVAPASAATLDVCPHGCAYSQVAAAVASANNGDTVNVAPGTYQGGFTISKDLTLNGAGARQTTISGGGPVITVGVYNAGSEPTVGISGVTITGGDTNSAFGENNLALGGGVWVPPATNNGTGATLTITGSVIKGNAVAPTSAVDAGFSCGPTGDCQFAQAGGGGIDSWGDVTLEHATVSNNTAAGAVTSDADGAGIYSQQGTLTLEGSVVTGNRAIATAPDGRFAEGAGIMFDTSFSPPNTCVAPAQTCALVIRDSIVSGNASTLTSNLPSFGDGALINMNANAGGIHVGDGIPTTVQNTTIGGNSVTATDPEGEPAAFDAAVNVGDSPLTMQNADIDHNHGITTSATSVDSGPSGTAIELDGPGTISDTKIDDNVATSTSPNGAAATNGGLAVFNFTGDPPLVTVENSVISGNITQAQSSTGSASVLGGAVFNNSLLLMRNVQISDNVGRAAGPTGVAQGGGIWNGVDLSGPPVQLTLENTSVTNNVLTGTTGITLQGGGLFTTSPVTLTNTTIERNQPDQCVGC